MKVRWLAVSVLSLVLAGTAYSGESPRTLPELVRAALASDEAVARAQSELRKAEAGVRLARSALLPRVELNSTYTRFRNELAWEIAPGESLVIQPLADWNWSADVSQTLFSGLRDWRAKDLASVQAEAAQLDRTSARLDLAMRVAQGFYDALGATQSVAVHRAAVEESEAQLAVAKRRFDVGEVASADVLRWQARLAAERRALVESEGLERLTRGRLARICNVDPVEDIVPLAGVPVPEGNVSQLTQRAFAQRPLMLSLDRQLKAAGLMVRIEKGNWLPQLDAHAQYYRQKSTFPSPDWISLALTLKVPVYDGGLTAARVARAREDEQQLELTINQIKDQVADQVEASAIGLKTAEAALRAAKDSRDAAREAHRQTERAYRAGEATATDVLAASTELTQAETAVVLARWQRELQAISLRRAVGIEPVPGVTLLPQTTEPEKE